MKCLVERKLKESIAEVRRIREDFGFTQKEIAEELGISAPVYSLLERGARNSSQRRREQIYYDVNHICYFKYKMLERDLNDLTKNTYQRGVDKVFNNVEEEIEDELSFDVIYPPLTRKQFNEALNLIMSGMTAIRAAVELSVCEQELMSRLDAEGYEYETGYRVQR